MWVFLEDMYCFFQSSQWWLLTFQSTNSQWLSVPEPVWWSCCWYTTGEDITSINFVDILAHSYIEKRNLITIIPCNTLCKRYKDRKCASVRLEKINIRCSEQLLQLMQPCRSMCSFTEKKLLLNCTISLICILFLKLITAEKCLYLWIMYYETTLIYKTCFVLFCVSGWSGEG